MSIHPFSDPSLEIFYIGPHIDLGPMPCYIYFSISAQESLTLDPYNQPVTALSSDQCRVFSVTLPGHHKGQDKFQAMEYWSKNLDELQLFLKNLKAFVNKLVDQNICSQKELGVLGLSRGGLIATLLCAQTFIDKTVSFAPITNLLSLEEFKKSILNNYKDLSIYNYLEQLISKSIRYYIGNHDMRVKTQSAFELVDAIAKRAYKERIRSPQVELIISPSIGLQGHGTAPHIFKEGALWIKKQIEK